MKLKKEHINGNIYLNIESIDDFKYFELAKKVTCTYFCADGYFYDPYKKTYLTKQAQDYILYMDEEGNKFETPIEVKVEWRLEKDV